MSVYDPYKATVEEIKTMVIEVLGGKWFDNPDENFNLNLGAIRNDEERGVEFEGDEDQTLILHENLFNDWIYLAWMENGEQYLKVWPATTDPGYYWRQEPGREGGVGAVREGYYPLVYRLGMHGSREALVQDDSNRPFMVYRDNDRDKVLKLDPATQEKGWGFNLHYMGDHGATVGKWSGGCQGSNDPNAIKTIVARTKQQRDAGNGDRVSYALMRRSWFRRAKEDGNYDFAKEDFRLIQNLPSN